MSLKERIAAIQLKEERDRQQRERAASALPPSPHPNGGGPAVKLPASASAGALKSKIAQFEGKGGVPIPRGSFGLGAPPVETGPKRRANDMLYGNRMQPARIPSATLGVAGLARPTEAFSAVDPRAVPLPESLPGSPISPQTTGPFLDGLSHTLSNGGRETPEFLRPKEREKKPIVHTRGTAFNTALDIARKAEADNKSERRKSGHWLTPQHTGGALLPQFTGSSSSGLTAQYTGGTLTPQHTGGGKLLTPQHTGGGILPQYTGSSLTSGTLVPQHTGESSRSMSSPPLSPVGYSPRGFGSPASPSRREARLSLFSPSMEPLVLSEENGPSSPRMLLAGGEQNDDVFVAEPDSSEAVGIELDETETKDEIIPVEELTSTPMVDAVDEVPLEESAQEESTPIEEPTPIPNAHVEVIDESAEEVLPEEPVPTLEQDAPATEVEIVPAPTVDSRQTNESKSIASIDMHDSRSYSHSHSASIDTHGSLEDAPSSPGSAHTGLDLDAHLHERAFPSHTHHESADSSRPSSVISVEIEHSHFDDDDEDADGDEVLLPLPNTLHTHAFRAHLSTITERSWMEGGTGSAPGSAPGSAAWDGRFGVYDVEERRHSGGSDRYGGGVPESPAWYKTGAGEDEEETSNPPGSAFMDGFADADKRRTDGVKRNSQRFGAAGYDTALGAYGNGKANRDGKSDDVDGMSTLRARPTGSRPAYPTGAFGSLNGVLQSFNQGTTSSAADAPATTDFQPPKDAVIYSGVGSPYRLSGLTERGYTPSLRSRSSSQSDSVHVFGDEAERANGEGTEGEERNERSEGDISQGVEEPPTPHANAAATADPLEKEETDLRTPTIQQQEPRKDSSLLTVQDAPSQRDSLLSQPDSLLALYASQDNSLVASQRNSLGSQRDSVSEASQRDSLSSVHTQVLSLRPLSVLSDGGSPSHVALAHRVPVAEEVAALGVARAMFIPSSIAPDVVTGNLPSGEQSPTTPSGRRQLPTPPTLVRSNSSPRASSSSTTASNAAEQAAPARRRYGYTTGIQRPHTEYIPPAPDSDEEADMVGEFGTVSFGFGESAGKRSFRAVVHGRVRETSSSRPNGNWDGASGSGSQVVGRSGDDKQLPPMPPTPLSPGFASGDLAELLAEAAALEQRLERGELPGEALRRRSMRQSMKLQPHLNSEARPPMPPIPQSALQQGTLEPLRPARTGSLKGLNPLSRSKSDRRRDRNKEEKRAGPSSSMGNLLQMQEALSSPPPALVDNSMTTSTSMPALSRSKSSAQYLSPISPSATSTNEVPPTPPPKSPGSRYFSSLRRLASTSRGLPGVGRASLSSSEDSAGLPITPDQYDPSTSTGSGQSTATGGHPMNPQANLSPHGSPHFGGVAWPALTNKKSVGSLGKSAANFAGKMWHRSRSKSNTSTVSSLSEGASSPQPPMPVAVPPLPSPSVLVLDANSSTITPFIIPPIQTSSHEPDPLSESPTSSTPIADPLSSRLPPLAPLRTKSHPVPHTRPPALVLAGSTSAPSSMLPVPKTAPESRPESWTSVSTTSSSAAASPLFDKAIFDAFPSVPGMPRSQPQPVPVPRPLPAPNVAHSPSSISSSSFKSDASSPVGSVRRPLPPPGYSGSDTSPIRTTSPTIPYGAPNNSFGRDGLLTRLAETQMQVDPLP